MSAPLPVPTQKLPPTWQGDTKRPTETRPAPLPGQPAPVVFDVCDLVFWIGVLADGPSPLLDVLSTVVYFGCEALLEYLRNYQVAYPEGAPSPWTTSPDYDPAPAADAPSFRVYVTDDRTAPAVDDLLHCFRPQQQCPEPLVVPEEEVQLRAYNGALELVYGPDVDDPQQRRKAARRLTVVAPKADLFPANWTDSQPDTLQAIRTRLSTYVPQLVTSAQAVTWFQPGEYKRRCFCWADHQAGETAIKQIYQFFSTIEPEAIAFSRETSDRFKPGAYRLISAQMYASKPKFQKAERLWVISF